MVEISRSIINKTKLKSIYFKLDKEEEWGLSATSLREILEITSNERC
jgi:chemotaxis signal transduction protein